MKCFFHSFAHFFVLCVYAEENYCSFSHKVVTGMGGGNKLLFLRWIFIGSISLLVSANIRRRVKFLSPHRNLLRKLMGRFLSHQVYSLLTESLILLYLYALEMCVNCCAICTEYRRWLKYNKERGRENYYFCHS
jgi:hypothetical protein